MFATAGDALRATVSLVGSTADRGDRPGLTAPASPAAALDPAGPLGLADAVHAPAQLGSERLRAAVCGCPAGGGCVTYDGQVPDCVDDLLCTARPGEVLVTASIAVLAGHELPPGLDSLDHGVRRLPGHVPERIYALQARSLGASPAPDDSHVTDCRDAAASPRAGAGRGRSNLGWARRAVPAAVVGRDEQIDGLEAVWRESRRGRRHLVLISGEAGIGKSTVAATVALRAHAQGALVLYGRWDHDHAGGYQAVREALATYAAACPIARLRDELGPHADQVARLLPEVGRRVGGSAAPSRGDATHDRLLLFTAIEGWLDAIAAHQPVLLVLDDLHWADPESVLLLRHLGRPSPPTARMILVTGRDGAGLGIPGDDDRADGSARPEGLVRMPLAGLDTAAVAQLVAAALPRPLAPSAASGKDPADRTGPDRRVEPGGPAEPAGPVGLSRPRRVAWADGADDGGQHAGQTDEPHRMAAQEAIAALGRSAAGNPLLLLQILRALPAAIGTGTRWRQRPVSADELVMLLATVRKVTPERLADVVRWRLAQLSRPTGEVLFAAAVVGRPFDAELLADVAAMPPRAVETALAEAEHARLLRLDLPGSSHAAYGFVHDAFREALREAGDPDRAAWLHRRTASALVERAAAGQDAPGQGPIDPADIAHHFLVGADPRTVDDAVRWARTAAEAAARQAAHAAAIELLGRAVTVHDRHAMPGDEADTVACELRIELADAHLRCSRYAEPDRRLIEAATLARRLDRPDLLARAALRIGGPLPLLTSAGVADRLLAEALDRLSEHDRASRARLLARRMQMGQLTLPYERRRAGADEAVALARQLGDPALLAEVLLARANALGGPDDVDDELVAGDEIREIGERIGRADLVLESARLRVPALLVTGRHVESRALAADYGRLAGELRQPGHAYLAALYGEALWAPLEGRYAEADALTDLLHVLAVEAGHPRAGLFRVAQDSTARWLRGVDRGLGLGPVLADRPRPSSADALWMWAGSVLVDLAVGLDEPARAALCERDPVPSVGRLDKGYMWWPAMIACTVAAATAGDAAWAGVLAPGLEPYGGQSCVFKYGAFAGAVDHHLGTLAAVRGRDDEAVARLDRGLARHEVLGAAPFVALSACWLAHVLDRRGGSGDRRRAADLRHRSAALAARLGLHGLPRFPAPTPAPAGGGHREPDADGEAMATRSTTHTSALGSRDAS